uniref:BHLH domain-containing protein n=1 Tax=Parastrongyloides trichosuri TaxID=131310 RepID=A0A0N4ZGC6_PARTI
MFTQTSNVSPNNIYNNNSYSSNHGIIDIKSECNESVCHDIYNHTSPPHEPKILIESSFVPKKRGRKRKCETVLGMDDEESAIKHTKQIEKVRNTQINEYFGFLQRLVPFLPHKQRLPKIKLLKLTMCYIEHLKKCINEEVIVDKNIDGYDQKRVVTLEDFKDIAIKELQKKNSYVSQAIEEMKRYEEVKVVKDSNKDSGRSSSDSLHSVSTNNSLDGSSNLTTIGNICYETVNINNYNYILDNNYHYSSHHKDMMLGF